jgi:integrase
MNSFVETIGTTSAVRYVPPAEDVQKVLLAATPWETDIITILLHTGARIGEVRNLLWDDLSIERKELRLWTRKRKGGARQYRTLAMNPTLETMFKRLWKERNRRSPYVFTNPVTGTGWTKNNWPMKFFMARICERSAVKKIEFHAIRHYVARLARDSKKATSYELQKFLGHMRLGTTEIYLRDLGSSTAGISQILEDLVQNPTAESLSPPKKQKNRPFLSGFSFNATEISGGEGGIRTLDQVLSPIPA